MSSGEFRDSGNHSQKIVGVVAGEAHALALTGKSNPKSREKKKGKGKKEKMLNFEFLMWGF